MKKIMLVLALAIILLSSCFLPENYECNITIDSDGSYTFTYEGELNYMPAIEAVIEGKFDLDAEEDLEEIIESLKTSEGFQEVVDMGRGKIKVEVEEEIEAGEDYVFMSKDLKYFAMEHNDENQLVISGFVIEDESKEDIEKFNHKLEGTLTVTLPKKMKVKSHNADKKEKIDKKTRAYIWELDYNSEKPEMTVKL